jgi:hypothetical protein
MKEFVGESSSGLLRCLVDFIVLKLLWCDSIRTGGDARFVDVFELTWKEEKEELVKWNVDRSWSGKFVRSFLKIWEVFWGKALEIFKGWEPML